MNISSNCFNISSLAIIIWYEAFKKDKIKQKSQLVTWFCSEESCI